jgi:hypothetical protein
MHAKKLIIKHEILLMLDKISSECRIYFCCLLLMDKHINFYDNYVKSLMIINATELFCYQLTDENVGRAQLFTIVAKAQKRIK